MDVLKYETKIRLYNSYFDANDHLSLKAILNIFQDVAAYHAEKINVGYEELLKLNLYWVLSRIKFDIIKMPKIDEEVIVTTWPHEKGKVDFDRDITISSLSNEVLIIASTKWCVIDTKTRMLQRSLNVNYNGICTNEKNYQEKFTKILIPDKQPIFKFTYQVSYSDLDHNHHMNNTSYAIPIINAINNKNIKHFEINYLNECLLNDTINIYSLTENNEEIIIGLNNEKQAFVAKVY